MSCDESISSSNRFHFQFLSCENARKRPCVYTARGVTIGEGGRGVSPQKITNGDFVGQIPPTGQPKSAEKPQYKGVKSTLKVQFLAI